MHKKLTDETEGIEEISESEIIDETLESNSETESIKLESEFDESKSIKELAREKLKAKLDEGYDLANRNEKSRICHSIADEIANVKGTCSYDAVAKEVKSVLKVQKKEKSGTGEGTKKVDGHSLKIKKTGRLKRPDRETPEQTEESPENLNEFEQRAIILKQFQEKGESAEEMMINFTLQDVSFFIEALGLPKPQVKRLKQRAKQIAMFNEIQRINGNPENVISISDNILKPLMMLGLGVTFLEPIIKKYFPKNDKKDDTGIKTNDTTMRA